MTFRLLCRRHFQGTMFMVSDYIMNILVTSLFIDWYLMNVFCCRLNFASYFGGVHCCGPMLSFSLLLITVMQVILVRSMHFMLAIFAFTVNSVFVTMVSRWFTFFSVCDNWLFVLFYELLAFTHYLFFSHLLCGS